MTNSKSHGSQVVRLPILPPQGVLSPTRNYTSQKFLQPVIEIMFPIHEISLHANDSFKLYILNSPCRKLSQPVFKDPIFYYVGANLLDVLLSFQIYPHICSLLLLLLLLLLEMETERQRELPSSVSHLRCP